MAAPRPRAHAPIVVEAGELTLAKGVALEKKSKLVVTASALGLDAHASAAADVKVAKASLAPSKDGGRRAFALKHRFRAGAGASWRRRSAAALPTLAEDDCSIELVVSSVDKSGKEGSGSAPRPSRSSRCCRRAPTARARRWRSSRRGRRGGPAHLRGDGARGAAGRLTPASRRRRPSGARPRRRPAAADGGGGRRR